MNFVRAQQDSIPVREIYRLNKSNLFFTVLVTGLDISLPYRDNLPCGNDTGSIMSAQRSIWCSPARKLPSVFMELMRHIACAMPCGDSNHSPMQTMRDIIRQLPFFAAKPVGNEK